MKFSTFDQDGFPTGFYDASIHVSIPAGAVQITVSQWLDILGNQGFRRWNGSEIVEHIPEPPAPTIPQSISRFQARAALLSAGLLTDVEAAVAAADPFAQLAWAEAQEWRRDSPTLLALAHGIGLTEAEIDACSFRPLRSAHNQ